MAQRRLLVTFPRHMYAKATVFSRSSHTSSKKGHREVRRVSCHILLDLFTQAVYSFCNTMKIVKMAADAV